MLHTGLKGLRESYITSKEFAKKFNAAFQDMTIILNGLDKENYTIDGILKTFKKDEYINVMLPDKDYVLQLTEYKSSQLEYEFHRDEYRWGSPLLFEEEVRPCSKYGAHNVIFIIYDREINTFLFFKGTDIDMSTHVYLHSEAYYKYHDDEPKRKCYRVKQAQFVNLKEKKVRLLYDYNKIKDMEDLK